MSSSEEHKDWNHKETFNLIEMYQARTFLYDTFHADYKNSLKRANAIEEFAEQFDTTASQVRSKIAKLRRQYANERRIRKLTKNHKDGTHYYKSKWRYFNALSFLEPAMQAKSSSDIHSFHSIMETVLEETESPVAKRTMSAKRKQRSPEIELLNEAMKETTGTLKQLLHTTHQQTNTVQSTDEDDAFCQYIKSELKSFTDPIVRRRVKNMLENVLFDAQLKFNSSLVNGNKTSSPFQYSTEKQDHMASILQ